jgi:hypothetical protein
MRKLCASVAVLVLCTTGLRADDTKTKDAKLTTTRTSCHGTAVEFVESPQEAAKLATAQKKLVLVLHVSGYFEDPNFT